MENQDIWDSNQANQKEYCNHEVFSLLKELINFYDLLSYSIPDTPHDISFIINFDTYLYSSISGTLDSINIVLKKGRINDAFSLIRKYHDSIIIDLYANDMFEKNNEADKKVVMNWLHNKDRKALPGFKKMSAHIENSKKLENIIQLLESEVDYRVTRDRCNDHTHYNFFLYAQSNDNESLRLDRLKFLNILEHDLKNVFTFHLVCLFSLKETYMMSDDYVGALEVGITPEENSQYWVVSFVQEIFTEIIKKHAPASAKYLTKNTFMELE